MKIARKLHHFCIVDAENVKNTKKKKHIIFSFFLVYLREIQHLFHWSSCKVGLLEKKSAFKKNDLYTYMFQYFPKREQDIGFKIICEV